MHTSPFGSETFFRDVSAVNSRLYSYDQALPDLFLGADNVLLEERN